ncbi:MAG: HAMP domain-containing histidine kinase [Erysipelotrichaceae bacterium]|jgi:signal transduction histidine kinase|nr:HAMP domain-containing histidine kinase [Erysipelotrichaceae bacterium]
MFKKLRNSMMLFNLLTVSMVLLAGFTAIYLVTYSNIERENSQRLNSVSSMFFTPNRPDIIIVSPNNENGNIEFSQETEYLSLDYGISFVLFVKDGQLMSVNSQLDLSEEVYREAYAQVGDSQSGKIVLEGRTWQYEISRNQSGMPGIMQQENYTRIVFLDITNSTKVLTTLALTLILVGLVVLAAVFFISYRFAVRAVAPIEENFNRQKQFVADASHELRTPLAIIGANIDAITASAKAKVESQSEWFGYIRAELLRTGKLVDDLLYLAKSEIVNPQNRQPFNISTACETACASMEAVFYENQKILVTEISSDIIVVGESDKLQSVIYILLDNAGKYTPKKGTITVSLQSEGDKAVLRVSNTGEGIASDDLKKIFERFYRSDKSRSSESGGFGLGLSIAKTIVESQGGSIGANSENGLTVFTVKLKQKKNN